MSDSAAPRSLAEALEIRRARPELVPVAGGTDLMVAVNFGRQRPPGLLDLTHVDELAGWRLDGDRLFVGAGLTFARVERELGAFAPLVEAAASVGSPQIRNRATLGGNVATGSPAGDSIPVLAAYDADVVVASRLAERRVRWNDFFLGPKRTALAEDELVVGLEWPVVAGPASFTKVGTRNAMVIAVASACLQLDPEARTVRLALGSVAPTVVRAPEAEAFAAAMVDWGDPGRTASGEVATEFGRLASRAAHPIDDVRGSASYRQHAVDVLARRALTRALADWRAAPC